MSDKVINTIKEALAYKNIQYVRPTDQVLDELGIAIHTWNKWIAKKLDPELWQLKVISKHFMIEIPDMVGEIVEIENESR